MKNIFLFLLFVFSIVFLYGVTFSIAQDAGADGKKIFEDKKCATCHSVTAVEITSKKKDAVDLSTAGDKLTADFLTKYLKKEEKLDEKEHKMAFKGTDQELQDLTKWLESLKSKEAK